MKKEVFDRNPILKLSFDLALMLVEYCEELEREKKYIVARQLLKSGTSVGANAMEAQNAESRADFIHKMRIAAKEAEETQFWLWLCSYSVSYPNCDLLLNKLDEVNRVLGTIVNSARKNIQT